MFSTHSFSSAPGAREPGGTEREAQGTCGAKHTPSGPRGPWHPCPVHLLMFKNSVALSCVLTGHILPCREASIVAVDSTLSRIPETKNVSRALVRCFQSHICQAGPPFLLLCGEAGRGSDPTLFETYNLEQGVSSTPHSHGPCKNRILEVVGEGHLGGDTGAEAVQKVLETEQPHGNRRKSKCKGLRV